MLPFSRRLVAAAALLTWIAASTVAVAQDTYRLQERFAVDDQYRVSTRSEVSGTLTLPPEMGKPAPAPFKMTGDSAIEYSERILAVTTEGQVRKTVRQCTRMDFRRDVGDRPQESTLRPAVRRLVVLREGQAKAPFSPDGPLTWGEIDLVRTDVFVPALGGLLPANAVRIGDVWTAGDDAVRELTGLTTLDEGKLECRLEAVQQEGQRRTARVGVSGAVRGTNEDGANRQQLTGHFLFDVDAGRIIYASLRGTHSLLAMDGKEVGRIEGRFLLSRQVDVRDPALSDTALRGFNMEPDAENSLLLYENAGVGVRFVYPRRWRVTSSGDRHVDLATRDGSSLRLTLEPPTRIPPTPQFVSESREYLVAQKGKILRVEEPRPAQGDSARERFGIEVEFGMQRYLMDYHISRQASGGVVIAARLLPTDQAALQRDVDRIARGATITKRIEERK
jgi:hypothetical protein